MLLNVISSPLKKIVKHLALVMLGWAMLCSIGPVAPATAAPMSYAEPALMGLAASSRFAAQAESEGAESLISEDRLAEMRERRRQWQSEASENAELEAEAQRTNEDSVEERLNLDDITQDNEMSDESDNS